MQQPSMSSMDTSSSSGTPQNTDPLSMARAYDAKVTACFAIQADVSSDVMPRVMQEFAKRDLVPTKWHSDVTSRRDETGHFHNVLWMDIQMQGMTLDLAVYLARRLQRIWGVDSVLVSEKTS